MVEYEIFVHVRRVDGHTNVHTDRYQADAQHTHRLLSAVDPAVASKFAKTYNLKPEDKVSDHRHA